MIRIFACGVNKYTAADDLFWCSNDAVEFTNTLHHDYLVGREQIIFASENGEISNWDYCKKLKQFCDSAKEDDLLIIFHSGHGGIDDNKDNYLLMSNSINEETRVYTDQIVSILNKSKAMCKLVILDCCRSDSGAKVMPPINLEKAIDELNMAGIAIMCSCKNDEFSYLDEEQGNISVFTSCICNALRSNHLSRNGIIFLNDLHNLVSIYANVYARKHPDKKQTPIMRTSIIGVITLPLRKPLPTRPEKSNDFIEYDSFEITNIAMTSKSGENNIDRKFVSASVILKSDFQDTNMNELIICIFTAIRKLKIPIENYRQERVRNNPVEIIFIHIANDYIDYDAKIWPCIATWTLHPDFSWHRNKIVNSALDGYSSYDINTAYLTQKQTRLQYTFPDNELISFWKDTLNIILKKTSTFINTYNDYVAGDITRKELNSLAAQLCIELNSEFDKCDDSRFPLPYSKYKEFDKISMHLYEDARSLLHQSTVLSKDRTDQIFKECLDMAISNYYVNNRKWYDELSYIYIF
jgi:Uncharacterized protein containing caspase domain